MQGKSRNVVFAAAGLPKGVGGIDGSPCDDEIVHALPVVVIVGENPRWATHF